MTCLREEKEIRATVYGKSTLSKAMRTKLDGSKIFIQFEESVYIKEDVDCVLDCMKQEIDEKSMTHMRDGTHRFITLYDLSKIIERWLG